MPACHAGGHEFESRTHRKLKRRLIDFQESMGFLNINPNYNHHYNQEGDKTMIKKTILLTMFAMAAHFCSAQERTTQATVYSQFKPSVIGLTNGRTIKQSLTNVFLKNSSLVYLKGEYTMEANMDNILTVEFDNRKYYNIHNQLAYVVDSVGKNILYRIDLLDLVAYNQQIRNNINISNMGFENGGISTTTMDINGEDDYKFPVIANYYYLYNGELVRVHEREVSRVLPKDKDLRRKYRTIIGMDDFSWTKDESLIRLLKAITVDTKE